MCNEVRRLFAFDRVIRSAYAKRYYMRLQEIRYRPIVPSTLNRSESAQIAHAITVLERETIESIYRGRNLTPEQVDHYLHAAEETRTDLRRATGANLLAKDQLYGRQLGILAVDAAGEPCAYMGIADNVSSSRPGRLGTTERTMKMNVNARPFIKSRYMWIGNVVMNEVIRMAISNDPTEANPVDVMFALAAGTRVTAQPVSAYTSVEETALNAELTSLGLERAENEQLREVYAFGEQAGSVELHHWQGSIFKSMGAAMDKPGARDAIWQAIHEQGPDYQSKAL